MTTVRTKFKVTSKSEQDGTIMLQPVQSGSEENAEFYKLTPSGSIALSTVNPKASEAFKVDAEFYVDFIPVEEQTPVPAPSPVP